VKFPPELARFDDLWVRIAGADAELTSGKLPQIWADFVIGGIFVVIHPKFTLNCNSVTSDKTCCVWLLGSGLDDWIYWHFFTITINYDNSQSMTRSIPCWTTSVFSSA
jgi:hypothetical protein